MNSVIVLIYPNMRCAFANLVKLLKHRHKQSSVLNSPHVPIHEVDLSLFPRMIESVLTPGCGVQVQVDTHSILPRPPEDAQDVLPRCPSKEGFLVR